MNNYYKAKTRAIGQHMTDPGLKVTWVEIGVYGETTAERILDNNWNRVVRAHKLTFEALWRNLWPSFEEGMADNKNPVDKYITYIAKGTGRGFSDKKEELFTDKVAELLLRP
jgi:hypothetical protein